MIYCGPTYSIGHVRQLVRKFENIGSIIIEGMILLSYSVLSFLYFITKNKL